MKHFPDTFPIRQALLVEDIAANNELDSKEREFLYNQLVKSIQESPPKEGTSIVSYLSVRLGSTRNQGPHLITLKPSGDYEPEAWLSKAYSNLEQLYPGSTPLPGGDAIFRITPLSYHAHAEIPFFFNSYNNLDTPTKAALNFELHGMSKLEVQTFYDAYQGLMAGNAKPTDLLSWSAEYGKAAHVGVEANHIIVRSLGALFSEELVALYELARYCKNCKRALPWDFTGSYCSTPECVKNRARKRQQKHSQNKA